MNREFDVPNEDLLIDDFTASQAIIDKITETDPKQAIAKYMRVRHYSEQMNSVFHRIAYLDELVSGLNENEKIEGSVFVGGALACMVIDEVALRNQFPRQEIYARWLTDESVALRFKAYIPAEKVHQESRDMYRNEGAGAFERLPKHLQDVIGVYYVNTESYNNLDALKTGYGRTLANLSSAFEGCYSDTMDVELEKMLGQI